MIRSVLCAMVLCAEAFVFRNSVLNRNDRLFKPSDSIVIEEGKDARKESSCAMIGWREVGNGDESVPPNTANDTEANADGKLLNVSWDVLCSTLDAGHESIAAGLISRMPEELINTKNDKGQTLLHILSSANRYVSWKMCLLVSLLVEYGADLDIQDNDGNTPLHLSCAYNHHRLVQVLLKAGANVNVKNNIGETALHLACRPKVEIYQAVAAKSRDVDQATDGINEDDDEDDDVEDDEEEEEDEDEQVRMVGLLIEHDSEVDVADQYGVTPIHHACSTGKVDLVMALVVADAETDVLDYEERSLLHYALPHYDVFEYLVEKAGMDLDDLDLSDKQRRSVDRSM